MDPDEGVALFYRFDQLGGAPSTAQHPIHVRVMAIVSALQHRFGLLLLDTDATQRKSEFVTAAHGQDRVEQASRGKNVHSGDTKIRPQGLVNGLRDDLRMTNRVRARKSRKPSVYVDGMKEYSEGQGSSQTG